MKIESSLDWFGVSEELAGQMVSIGYNPDLKKMYQNINTMVSELSNLEVIARRTHKPQITISKLNQINQAIDRLEKFILIATLMK